MGDGGLFDLAGLAYFVEKVLLLAWKQRCAAINYAALVWYPGRCIVFVLLENLFAICGVECWSFVGFSCA